MIRPGLVRRGLVRRGLVCGVLLTLAACAGAPDPEPAPKLVRPAPAPAPEAAPAPLPKPAILRADRPLQCVPYAREVSGIQLRGDAWTWWGQARGTYARGDTPKPGAIIQLDTGRKRGHLAVVKRVTGPRRIIVDHANWLNRGRIHRNTPIVDISAANNWSRVRVWYTPGNQLGSSPYPVVGFIYPERMAAEK